MPGANDITVANIGTVRPLSYGFVRVTGMPLIDYTDPSDGTEWGFWALGDGEWDGFDTLWVNDLEIGWDWDAGTYHGAGSESYGGLFGTVHFHPGTDTPPGSSLLFATSTGYDQLLDQFWDSIPDVCTRLAYSGLAYYAIQWLKEPLTAGQKMSPIGDWRAMRCRMFDDMGNQTSYGFTTNPIWHFVDTWLRIAILPRTQYSIHLITGPDALPSDVKSRFDWGSVYEAAQYCDAILANGQPRFSGSYAFTSQTTLAAIHEQILLCCRGYQQEYAGKIYVNIDQPRSSVFLLTAKHLIPETLSVDETQIKANANLYTAEFLDLNLPAVATVASISMTAGVGTITISGQNPIAPTDTISIGGNSASDLNIRYYVTAVSGSTVSAKGVGSLVTDSGTGGTVGYMQSRFSKRAPYLLHTQHALAEGQLSAAVSNKARKKLSVTLNFANMSFDQQNRLLKYEIYRDLGLDQVPWKPPIQITLNAWAEAVDASWNVLKSAQCGDVITIDPTASFEFAGEYEIIERKIYPFQGDASMLTTAEMGGSVQGSGTLQMPADQNDGYIQLLLRTYNGSSGIFPDVSDTPQSSFATVPGEQLWSGPGPVNSIYQVLGDTLSATDAGTSVTIAWSDVSLQLGSGKVLNYADGSALGEPYSTDMFAFVDDPFALGGNIPLQFTAHPGALTNAVGRMFIDDITTPASGGGGTGGGGHGGGGGLPGCFVVGTPIHTSAGIIPNDEFFARWKGGEKIMLRGRECFEEVESAEWLKVDGFLAMVVSAHGVIRCSLSTTLLKSGEACYLPAATFKLLDFIDTLIGWRPISSIQRLRRPALVLVLKMKGPSKQYLAGEYGIWSHNVKDSGL